MESQLNDATSFQQSNKPMLCANGCGFFGTPATMNLCSKCYRDHCLKEEKAVEKSMSSISPPVAVAEVALVAEERGKEKSFGAGAAVVEASSADEPPRKPSNRCDSCNKKFGVMGFKCRCGSTFCRSHRYPEEHDCEFDYKVVGRNAIAKANPVVKADKVDRL